MRSFVVAVALFACACGEVLKATENGPPDAYVPDAAVELTCAATETVCNGSCADLQTSELYCGNCMTQCAPNHSCLAGTCVPTDVSCARVRELNPGAATGIYVNPNNNGSFYCHFESGQQWEIVTNPYTSVPAGFTTVRSSDFGNADFVRAFIELYNHDKGFRSVAAFTPSNCCITSVAGLRYTIGSDILFTGLGTASFCNVFISVGQYISFGRNGSNYGQTLPADYFTTNPMTESANCSDSTNASWSYKRTPIN